MSSRARRGLAPTLAFLAALLASLALGPSPCAGLKVLELNATTLDQAIEKHKKLLLVEFFSPDCAHCQRLEPVLEAAADELVGKASVVKIDSRNAHHLNQKYSVRQTPTMVLFRGGHEIAEAREDLQGFRTTDSLVPFVLGFRGPTVAKVGSRADVDEILADRGVAVCGVFTSEGAPSESFRDLARRLRGHIPFAASVADAEGARLLSETYGLRGLPTIFVAKRHNYTVEFHGNLEAEGGAAEAEAFIERHGFPLVGNLSALTYARYLARGSDRAYLFYDPGQRETAEGAAAFSSAERALGRVAASHDDVSFIAVSSVATENGRTTLLQDSGLTELRLPALALVSSDAKTSVALCQLGEVTEEAASEALDEFLRLRGEAMDGQGRHVCLAFQSDRADGEGGSSDPRIVPDHDYELHAHHMKAFWGLGESSVREVSEQSHGRVMRRTWRDTLVVYVARWCSVALKLERLLEDLVASGEVSDLLEEELSIVKVDAVLTPAPSLKGSRRLPAMKYVSARYKDFPYWFGGDPTSKPDVLEFIRTHHSMRRVEIPGEGPSPFADRRRDVMEDVVSALGAAKAEL